DAASDALRLEQVRLDCESLSVTTGGTLTALSTRQDVSVEGSLRYDLAKLEPQLRALIGPGARLRGAQTRPFRVSGPLGSPVQLGGEMGIGWEAVQAFGCDIGPGELKGRLRDGWLAFDPIAAPLNGGRLWLETSLRF